MRQTKIVCTIGPACEKRETLIDMLDSGMNVARLNFSHGTHEEHQEKIDLLKSIREETKKPLAIMLDTKGPEYRIGMFENGKVFLEDSQSFTFWKEDKKGNESGVSVSYKNLAKELDVGDKILVNNGLVIFSVSEISGDDVVCRVESGGELSNRKSMSFPGKVFRHEFLSEQDKSDLMFAIKNDIDFVACSFVSTKQDALDVKNFLKENGAGKIEIIAKIENQSGIDNIEKICSECSGIMIGRGDLGVEVPFEELPAIQKQLITKCRMLGKRVITATEMLESMIHNPRPTRAEISDVANAVYDGTSAIMLSGETAVGDHPALVVKTMSDIAQTTENSIDYRHKFYTSEFNIKNEMDAISHSTVAMAIDIGAKAIVVCSVSGTTARMVSRFRPPVNIIGMTVNQKTYQQLSLSWGITPAMCEVLPSIEVLFFAAKKYAKEMFNLIEGDKVVITGGTSDSSGKTNTIRIETI